MLFEQGIPLFRSVSEDSAVRKFWFPVSRPDYCAIPSGHPDRPSIIRPDDVYFTVSRSFCSSLHPSGGLSSPSRRPSVFNQASDSFQNYIWEDCCNRPDAQSLIWKLLAAEVRPSELQCHTVRTRLSNRKDFQ
jgi:hypothetical protein